MEIDNTMPAHLAEEEFAKFAEAWDLDVDPKPREGDEEAERVHSFKKRFIRAFEKGRLLFDPAEEILTYTLIVPVKGLIEMRLTVPNGAAYLAMDRYKDSQGMHKLNAFAAHMSEGVVVKQFAELSGKDIKLLHAIASIFLAA